MKIYSISINLDSSVNIVPPLNGHPKNHIPFSGRDKKFFLLARLQTDSGTPQSSY